MNEPAAASFRDPAGCCFLLKDRVLRFLDASATETCEAFLRTPTAQRFVASRQLVSSRRLSDTEIVSASAATAVGQLDGTRSPPAAVYEHERIPFPSYACEWPPEMLWEAGRLTLELARTALADGFSLKDATPYNILFRGSEPVFIDLPSFEPRVPGDPVWRPYAQFVRTFLLPLLANRNWGLRLADIFITHRDGLEPAEVYRLCGVLERFQPRMLSLVSMPTWLSGKARTRGRELYRQRTLSNPEKARFVLESLLRQLERGLESVKPASVNYSTWSEYMHSHSYSGSAFAAKEQFVREVLNEFKPARVLDAGANTGHFSALAAQNGAEVVALDLDPTCVGGIWRRAREQRLNILPLVVDISRPSPALGWRNRECPSFLERATGSFDGVLMLALLHHLLVTERIPLAEVLKLAAELTRSLLVIEFVAPEDEMFQELVRGREHLHAGLNEQEFEQACARHFNIVRSLALPGTKRKLYALRRRDG